MMTDRRNGCTQVKYVAIISAALTVSVCPTWAMGVFAGFPGHWAGSGSLSMADGSRESIRCRAEYVPGTNEDALGIDVTCGSDSYRINIIADISAHGNAISGSWRETTRQIQGNVSGEVPRPGQMQASLTAVGGGIQLAATATGKLQAITIRSQGTEVVGADITLKRR